MWNYNFVFPSLLVLVIFLIYYFGRRRLPIRMNRTFLKLLIVDLLVIVSDLLASWADDNHQTLPQALLVVLNLAFFVLYIARVQAFFQFTLYTMRVRLERTRWKGPLIYVVYYLSEAIILSSPVTGAVFSIDAAGYHRGPLYVVLPICSFFYLALGLFTLALYYKRIKRGEAASILCFHIVLLVGNVVRILLPQYLVMNTFCLMAVIIIYLSFQNPDLYLSDRGPAFNSRAFRDMLGDTMYKKDFRILGFVLRDYNDERGIYGGIQMDQGLGLIIRYLLRKYPQYTVFYLRSGCFAIVGPENMDWDGIKSEIARRFEQPWEADDVDLYLHVSFVELSTDHLQKNTAEDVINTLLIALDRVAQTANLDQNILTPENLQEIYEQMDVKRNLERALEQDAVEVFLQPIVDGKTRKLAGAEALARLRNEEGHLLSPALFVPIAEKNGHIGLMGEQVLRKVCRFIHENDIHALGLQWINVNLSPIQCMRRDLADRLSAILDEYQVNPGDIHLEITEESMVDYSLLEKQVDNLKKRGFQFALDDYGAGYSNLSRVKQYPFSNIKLDMTIVWAYVHDRNSLLPALARTFKEMNFTITAEGIETQEMAEAMEDIDCDYLQGYLFSKPLPMEEFVEKYGA